MKFPPGLNGIREQLDLRIRQPPNWLEFGEIFNKKLISMSRDQRNSFLKLGEARQIKAFMRLTPQCLKKMREGEKTTGLQGRL